PSRHHDGERSGGPPERLPPLRLPPRRSGKESEALRPAHAALHLLRRTPGKARGRFARSQGSTAQRAGNSGDPQAHRKIPNPTDQVSPSALIFSVFAAAAVWFTGRRDAARDPRLTVIALALLAGFPLLSLLPELRVLPA